MALKTRVFTVLAVVLITACAARAQELPPPVPPPVPPPTVATPELPQQITTIPAPVAPVAAPSPLPVRIDLARRREQIGLMEGLLAGAVRNGAQETARQIQQVQPGLTLFTGTARAQGTFLEDYGVFFNVEIPGVQPSVEWILETLERSRAGRQPGGQASLTNTTTNAGMLDPGAVYTDAVQNKLIDAMIDFRIDLLANEWLTVAARDGVGPIGPGELYQSITMVLRLKGSDVHDFVSGRITRAELRKKVQVREF